MGADSQGSRPGSTFQAMREKARAGQLRGKTYNEWASAVPSGTHNPPNRGQGTSVVTRSPLDSKNSGNSPWERNTPLKPGA